MREMFAAALLALALPLPAAAQPAAVESLSGTRLDVVATGEVTRIPDVVRIHAGVVTQAPTAVEAIRQNAQQVAAVRAALRRAGIADRDIQTSQLNLQPDYRHAEGRPPELTGYRAVNQLSVRFRDIANSGRILDALVAVGVNQINGPMLEIERPEAALDEARLAALANARSRADLYARSLGMRVKRLISVSESGARPPMPRSYASVERFADTQSTIDPGEQTLAISLAVSFELE
jgi:uncharacterized protein YggE